MRWKWTIFLALIVFLYGCQTNRKIEQIQTCIENTVISETTEPEASKVDTQENLSEIWADSSNQGNTDSKTDELTVFPPNRKSNHDGNVYSKIR